MTTETDVANLALQQCGAGKIVDGALWTEDTKNASEIRLCYDVTRRFELRRNVWRYSIRTEVLRKRTSTTKVIMFSEWDARVDYEINDRVRRDSKSWICVGEGVNNDPSLRTYDFWTTYIGSDTADVYDAAVSYRTGEQVYVGDLGYISLTDDNVGNLVTDITYWYPFSVAAWVQFKIYDLGDRVTFGGVTYVSLLAANQNKSPDTNPTWWVSTASQKMAVSAFQVPTASGLNIFRLPTGFMREAPQVPKQGSYTPLGAPAAPAYTDIEYEGKYFKTSMAGPINFRFAADIENPNEMDPMFISGFSNRLAFTVCEVLTQSNTKLAAIGGSYNKFMSEARTVNGIETGPIEAPEDSYISLRE